MPQLRLRWLHRQADRRAYVRRLDIAGATACCVPGQNAVDSTTSITETKTAAGCGVSALTQGRHGRDLGFCPGKSVIRH